MTPPFSLSAITSLATIATISLGTLVFSAPAAHARDWYTLNAKTGTCETVASIFGSAYQTPELLHAEFRAEGITDSVKVIKNADGEVTSINMTFNRGSGDITVMLFPAADTCETMLKMLIAKGILPNMDDLK